MSVSTLFTAEQAYMAAVSDYSAAMASALSAVRSKSIMPSDFDEYLMDLLSVSFGQHMDRGELINQFALSATPLASHVAEGIEL